MNIFEVCEQHNIELSEIGKDFDFHYQPTKDTHYAMQNDSVVFIGNLLNFPRWCENAEYNIKRHNIYGSAKI